MSEKGKEKEYDEELYSEEAEELEETSEADSEEVAESEADAEEVEDSEELTDSETDSEELEDSEDVSEEEQSYEEDEEPYDDGEDIDEEEYRRILRHSRRIRNQIIAYSVVFILLIAIAFGLFTAGKFVHKKFAGMKAAKQVEEEAKEEEKQAEEEKVIEAPEEVSEEEEVEEEPEEVVDYLGEAVKATVDSMSTEDKVAQLFIVSPEAITGVSAAIQAGDGTRDALDKYAVGGLVYDSKNIQDSEQFTTLITNTVNMSKYKLLLAVNEPGGAGSVLEESAISDIPSVDSPKAISESGDSSQAYNAGMTVSSYMSALGLNMDIAPSGSVLSIEDSVDAELAYGSDEAVVYDMVVKMVEGLSQGKVFACMTGFPGLGNIADSTAEKTVESDISKDDLNSQLSSYISGIAAGAGLVQLNNVVYTEVDSANVPASLSKVIISDILRGNMGYEGIILTAPLDEKAITENMTSGEAALDAINAGADMLYMPDDFEEAYDAVLNAVNEGSITEERLTQSLERIYRLKLSNEIE